MFNFTPEFIKWVKEIRHEYACIYFPMGSSSNSGNQAFDDAIKRYARLKELKNESPEGYKEQIAELETLKFLLSVDTDELNALLGDDK